MYIYLYIQYVFISQASVTVLLTALLHVFFYFPMASTRVVALYSNAINVPPDVSNMLLAINFSSYAFAAPVHLANFVVRCVRVPGFARAVLCVIKFLLCPCIRARGERGISDMLTQITRESH